MDQLPAWPDDLALDSFQQTAAALDANQRPQALTERRRLYWMEMSRK